ncbi:hypothetical protein UT300005_14800 [Clostridium sp. CTA-5]
MKKNKRCINFILGILLMFSIMLGVVSIFVNNMVLNKNTYVNIFNENDIYKKVTESLYKKIDSILSAKGVSVDIKESILTEDDIKNEADNAIDNLILYLKTGENNTSSVNTDIYKERVRDVLKSFIGENTSLDKDLSFVVPNIIGDNSNSSFSNHMKSYNTICIKGKPNYEGIINYNQKLNLDNMVYGKESNFENLTYVNKEARFDNMVVKKEKSSCKDDCVVAEKLASRAELEAQGRAMLREKGLSEAQARQKLAEKGLTEDDVWRMLAEEGYLDENNSSGNKNDKASGEKEGQEAGNSAGNNNSVSENNKEVSQSNNKLDDEKNATTSVQAKVDAIANKLLDEAGAIIDKEFEKISINGLMKSNVIRVAAKTTSIFNTFNLIFILSPILFIGILILVNKRDINSILKYTSIGAILAGILLSTVFFGIYTSKAYEMVNINTIYLKEAVSSIMSYFLITLSKCGLILFILGLILMIPNIDNILGKSFFRRKIKK